MNHATTIIGCDNGEASLYYMYEVLTCVELPRIQTNIMTASHLPWEIFDISTVKKQKDVTHTFSKMFFFLVIWVDYHILHLIEISKKFHPYYFLKSEQKLILEINL